MKSWEADTKREKIERPTRYQNSYQNNLYWFAVILAVGFLGALAAGVCARYGSNIPPKMEPLFPFVGFAAAVCIGIGIVSALVSAQNERERWRSFEQDEEFQPQLPDVKPNPRSFHQRLDRFTDKPFTAEEEDRDEFQSKMPFWSAEKIWTDTPPKSAGWIHFILMRIRNLLTEK
jgi:hypothetical protein